MYHGNNSVSTMTSHAPIRAMDSASIASGLAFLNGEFEKRDEKLYEPLTSVTWATDIVAVTGGGWSEYSSNYFVDYGTTGGGASGIIGTETNDIPVMQANISKDTFKVFNWAKSIKIPWTGNEMMKTVGRSLDDMLNKGIKLSWGKDLDTMVYEGYKEIDVYGLVNNPVVQSEVAKNGAAGSPLWSQKTPDEIVDDINSLINETWEASEYDLTGMANHILIDPKNYAYITSRKVSDAGNVSILQYIMENNIAKNQGRELVIVPRRWCSKAGAGATSRMVAYVNDKDRVRIDIPVMLNRVMTQPVVQQMAYMTAYAGQIGQVKVLYNQTIRYKDGI